MIKNYIFLLLVILIAILTFIFCLILGFGSFDLFFYPENNRQSETEISPPEIIIKQPTNVPPINNLYSEAEIRPKNTVSILSDNNTIYSENCSEKDGES